MKELNSLKATLQEAQSRVRGGDARTALELLQAAMPVHGESVDLHMNVAIAQRALGNYPAAIESLNAVLAIDPYTFMALLSKGSILEQMGLPRQAAEVYRNALRIAPPDAKLPTGLAAPMQQARAVIARQSEAMAAHFRDALGPILESHEGEALGRDLLDLGPHTAVVTLGEAGAVVASSADAPWGERTARHGGFAVDAVDATGAGDAFTAGLIARLSAGDAALDAAVAFANATAALSVREEGGMTALPSKGAVASFLAERA